jgi:hypothetical protein
MLQNNIEIRFLEFLLGFRFFGFLLPPGGVFFQWGNIGVANYELQLPKFIPGST